MCEADIKGVIFTVALLHSGRCLDNCFDEHLLNRTIHAIRNDVILRRGIQVIEVNSVHAKNLLLYNTKCVKITQLPVFLLQTNGCKPQIFSLPYVNQIFEIVYAKYIEFEKCNKNKVDLSIKPPTLPLDSKECLKKELCALHSNSVLQNSSSPFSTHESSMSGFESNCESENSSFSNEKTSASSSPSSLSSVSVTSEFVITDSASTEPLPTCNETPFDSYEKISNPTPS